MYTLGIDAGHGGENIGTQANGIVEKIETLRIAEQLRQYASWMKIDCPYMIRLVDEHLSLADRAKIAYDAGCRHVTVIHINAAESKHLNGMLAFHNQVPGKMDLGAVVGDTIVSTYPPVLKSAKNYSILVDDVETGSWLERPDAVLSPYTERGIHATLVELFYSTNKSDVDYYVDDYIRNDIILALLRGANIAMRLTGI